MPENPLKILFLSAEVTPFAKTGGLADVAGSLPKALRAMGHDIRVLMPRYGRIDPDKFGLWEVVESLEVPVDDRKEPARILQGRLGEGESEVPVYFVDNPRLYDRDGIYMYPDDAERFLYFSRAALELTKALNWRPDIVHANDWHTAFVPNWLKTIYQDDPFFAETATVYTIHNLAYQGIFGYRVLEIAGLAEYGFIYHPDGGTLNERVDFMARGILFADVITTVSKRYAEEILTPEYGENLDPLLRDRKDRLFGILNGIDTETLNPATDPNIPVNYDVESIEKRQGNKLALQREMGLPERPDVPLLGVISRLTDQKGFDLMAQIADPLFRFNDAQFVLLGTGDEQYHHIFQRLAESYPDHVAVRFTFNTPLAQRIYAGSDMFLMPSRFEPCGLGQMIAMRYGSVPVVRETGGLADTVENYDPITGKGHGFTFKDYNAMALYTALVRAMETYRYPKVWRKLMRRGMTKDFSWKKSAEEYVKVYRLALKFRRSL